jgi:hypothetical protein
VARAARGANRRWPAAVEVVADVIAISASGNGLQLVQRQFSDRIDKLRLIGVRHFPVPFGCINRVGFEIPTRTERSTG